MTVILIVLAALAAVFAADFPVWLDPLLLLLGFVALRVEAARLPGLVLLFAFLKGCSTLDPTWLHMLVGAAGTALVLLLRRRFFAARMLNQWWLMLLLAVVIEGGAVLPLVAAYGHAGREALLLAAAVPAAGTTAVAPLVYWALDHVVFRPRRLRRGLLPRTGG